MTRMTSNQDQKSKTPETINDQTMDPAPSYAEAPAPDPDHELPPNNPNPDPRANHAHPPMPHRGPHASPWGPFPPEHDPRVSGPGGRHGRHGPPHWHPFEGPFGRGRGGGRGGFRGGFRGGSGHGREGRCGGGRRGARQYGWGPPWLWAAMQGAMQGLDPSRQEAEGAAADDETDFSPSMDSFESEASYTLHFELPGAKKNDIGVHWDEASSSLRVSGVIHRPGDETFLQSLTSEERTVGVFERSVELEGRIRADRISAKLEDGILVIEVPKDEKPNAKVEVKAINID